MCFSVAVKLSDYFFVFMPHAYMCENIFVESKLSIDSEILFYFFHILNKNQKKTICFESSIWDLSKVSFVIQEVVKTATVAQKPSEYYQVTITGLNGCMCNFY